MGWANCGNDSKGRPIGYNINCTCDYPGCKAKIDRGLDHVCGNMHGNDATSCEKYFCSSHKRFYELPNGSGSILICAKCLKYNKENYNG